MSYDIYLRATTQKPFKTYILDRKTTDLILQPHLQGGIEWNGQSSYSISNTWVVDIAASAPWTYDDNKIR